MSAHVVVSDLRVDPVGADALEKAFATRMRAVEGHAGFQRLEVWGSEREDGAYVMVSWWDDEASFRAYMRSSDHRASHARIPTAPARARGVGVRRYRVVAD